jgi:hypothetical protein
MKTQNPLDIIIIGGGIGGVISLYYAQKAGLKALLLEKQNVVGGLWAQLPAWQDIQIHQKDWTLGDIPITGVDQASITRNIQAWVDKFSLASAILLNTPVTQAKQTATGWQVSTPTHTYATRTLIAATGAHNRPHFPLIERVNALVGECHSGMLKDPAQLAGKDVVVVGGGASAYDLLELCLEYRARKIVWVYRSLRWMTPTRKPKHLASDIRGLARQQMQNFSVEDISRGINLDLRGRYAKFGLDDIRPKGDFDFNRDQLIPGRHRMIENFHQFERYQGEITRIVGKSVELSVGKKIDADLILWGTGYTLDLSYFASPALATITSAAALAKRCGSLFRFLDAPNLYFLAPGMLEGTGSAPWAYAHAARTIMADIQGAAKLDDDLALRKINYFDLAKYLAARDPASFPPATWFSDYKTMAMEHPDDAPMPLP